MKKINEQLNKLRLRLKILIKNSKYLLLKKAENLSQRQQVELKTVLATSPCLRITDEMKKDFRQIYETHLTVKSGQIKMKKWLESAQLFYPEASQTIRTHLEGVCNYFINRTTSGLMEGINNKIKLIKRQGYGFSNFENFRSRLLAAFEHK